MCVSEDRRKREGRLTDKEKQRKTGERQNETKQDKKKQSGKKRKKGKLRYVKSSH